MIDIRKTATRIDALNRVQRGQIRYTPLTGTFREGDTVITGSQRRTYAELRLKGLIGVPNGEPGEPVTLTLTEDGEQVREQWVD